LYRHRSICPPGPNVPYTLYIRMTLFDIIYVECIWHFCPRGIEIAVVRLPASNDIPFPFDEQCHHLSERKCAAVWPGGKQEAGEITVNIANPSFLKVRMRMDTTRPDPALCHNVHAHMENGSKKKRKAVVVLPGVNVGVPYTHKNDLFTNSMRRTSNHESLKEWEDLYPKPLSQNDLA